MHKCSSETLSICTKMPSFKGGKRTILLLFFKAGEDRHFQSKVERQVSAETSTAEHDSIIRMSTLNEGSMQIFMFMAF